MKSNKKCVLDKFKKDNQKKRKIVKKECTEVISDNETLSVASDAEYSYNKMGEPLTNAGRLRYFLFWPITLLAFIWGLIEHILNNNNDDEL